MFNVKDETVNYYMNYVYNYMNVPESIKIKFINEIVNSNNDNIKNSSVSIDGDKVKIKFIMNDDDYVANYTIILDNRSNTFEINKCKTKESNNKRNYESHKKISLEFIDKGFIYKTICGETILDNNKFIDFKEEENIFFNDYGVEMIRKNATVHYPNREYNGKFTYGVNQGRNEEERIESTTYRTNIDFAINYIDKYNIKGEKISSEEKYYHLSNEHGLAIMNFNLGSITKEEYDASINNNEYDIEEITKNDFETSRNYFIDNFSKIKK